MKIVLIAATIMAAFTLTACETTQDEATLSGFNTPSATCRFSGGLAGNPIGGFVDSSGDGFAHTAGSISGKGLKAESGLLAGTDVTFRPSNGGGTYTGRYSIGRITNINLNNSSGVITGRSSTVTGDITLTADFEGDTLRGSAGGLVVNGATDGRRLSGNVTYQGVRGPLTGLVGGDKTVGAFHGNNEDLIYAGGFLADRD